MEQAIYLYQAIPSKGELLLANDSSSFTQPFFAEASEILAKVPSLSLSRDVSFYPNTAQEDAVMLLSRASFRLSEWLFPALIIGGDDSLQSALLMNRAHPEYVLIVSLKEKEVCCCCLNGVEIAEEEGEAMSGKEFLSTLSLASPSEGFAPKKQAAPVNLGYYDEGKEPIEEDEGPISIEIARPSFVPTSKKGTRDLGSSYSAALIEEEEQDEEVNIDVKKEAFSAGTSKKPRDLGSFAQAKKRTFIAPQSEEEEEPDPKAIASSYAKPGFEPNVRTKGQPAQASFSAPKVSNQRKYGEKKAVPVEPDSKTIASSFSKPDFEPNSKPKPVSKPSMEESEKNQRVYSSLPKEEVPTKSKELEENKIPEFVFSPSESVPGSRTIINDPGLMFVARKFVREGNKRFGVAPSDVDCSKTKLVDIKESEKAALLEKASAPCIANWDLLALNVEPNGMPHAYVLSNKEDPLLCAVYDLDEEGLSLAVLTHNGIAVLDPSLDYASLRSLCFPKKD